MRMASPGNKPDRSGRFYICWGAGMLCFLALAWLVGAVAVPIWRTRRAVVSVYSRFEAVKDMGGAFAREDEIYLLADGTAQIGNSDHALVQLRQYLNMPEWLAPHKWCAAGMLSACGPGASEPLVQALKHPDPMVRSLSAYALGILGPEARDAAPALIDALGDDCERTRANAAGALGFIGSSAADAIPALLEILEAGPLERRERFIITLDDEPPLPREQYSWNEWRLGQFHAIFAIGRIVEGSGRDGISALHNALTSENDFLRTVTIQAMSDAGPKAARLVPTLEKLLSHRDARTRKEAALALFYVTGEAEKPIRVLADMLSDADRAVRTRAMETLEKIGPAAAEVLPEMVRAAREDTSCFVRRAATTALMSVGPQDETTITALEELSKDISGSVRSHANYALKKIKEAEDRYVSLQ